jgi:multidrug efflux pump subunit AcrA (membrane-fusion protein)
VFDTVINYMDKFGPEILVIQFGFLIIVSTIFLWLWFSNRRKYQNLKHAIPANIVKSYLDSIIQNSTSLKSQLFRGGGIDVNGIPSVMPLHNLIGGEGLALSGAPSTALMEELNQKKAQLASLESQLAASQSAHRELENKLKVSQESLLAAEAKIKELEALLAKSHSDDGGDAALKSELKMVSKERDELRDRLKEFEIISDDLANLKRLQQENEQLKRSLAASGKTLEPSTPVEKEAVDHADVSDLFEDVEQANTEASDDTGALEDFLSEPDESEPTDEEVPIESPDEPAAEMQASEEEPEEKAKNKSEKTPEDLLSEFEKMLG